VRLKGKLPLNLGAGAKELRLKSSKAKLRCVQNPSVVEAVLRRVLRRWVNAIEKTTVKQQLRAKDDLPLPGEKVLLLENLQILIRKAPYDMQV
jgi:hypothetical protein